MSVNDRPNQNTLPTWMKQAQRGVDWGALLVIAFALFVGWSLITLEGLPATNDIESYIYRSADYMEAFSDGIAYPRWSPHTLNGYGAPVPHFYPSGAPYLSGLIGYLFTNDPITAIQIVMTGTLVIASSMMYAFVKQRTNALGGVIATLVYIFSPYVMVTVPYVEGDLPLVIGIALMPCLLWAVNRMIQRQQAVDFLLIACFTALTLITVPIVFLQASLAILTLIIADTRQQVNHPNLLRVLLALVSGVVLSAFYWLPALLHFNTVLWQAPILPSYPDELNIWDLLMPALPLDARFGIIDTHHHLGWGAVFAVLISVPMMWLRQENNWFSTSYLSLGMILLVLTLSLAPERSSWLVLIIFCLAIASSHIAQDIKEASRTQYMVIGIGIIVLTMSSAPMWVLPNTPLVITQDTLPTQNTYEQAGYGYSVLPAGYPLPSNISLATATRQSLVTERSSRLFEDTLAIPLIEETPYSGRYNIISTGGTNLTYERAYSPFWQARTENDQTLTLNPSSEGLITVEIPPNTDTTLTFRLSGTPITRIAWGITLSALLICLWVWWYSWRRAIHDYDESDLLTQSHIRYLMSLLFVLVVVRVAVTPLFDQWFKAQEESALNGIFTDSYTHNDNLVLIGYDPLPATVQQGESLNLTVYWRITETINNPYLVRLRMMDYQLQQTVYQTNYAHPANYPINRWHPSQVMRHRYNIPITDDIIPNDYILFLDIIDCESPCIDWRRITSPISGQISLSRSVNVED